MYRYRQIVLTAVISSSLFGCAGLSPTQPLDKNLARVAAPVDVFIGIQQPELYAAFEVSMVGTSAAATCGAIPGIGILLAGVCGGTMGAIDAAVNSSRAKKADEQIRPLKDTIIDVQFDQLMIDATKLALNAVPDLPLKSVSVTKQVDEKSYEALYKASAANSVMFINLDYQLNKDFSALIISTRETMFPLSAAAKKSAGQPENSSNDGKPLALEKSIYRSQIFYEYALPAKAATIEENVELWKANNASLLRAGLNNGTAQISKLLAEDLQRTPSPADTNLPKTKVNAYISAHILAEHNFGRTLRYPDGSIHYEANATILVAAQPSVAPPAVSIKETKAEPITSAIITAPVSGPNETIIPQAAPAPVAIAPPPALAPATPQPTPLAAPQVTPQAAPAVKMSAPVPTLAPAATQAATQAAAPETAQPNNTYQPAVREIVQAPAEKSNIQLVEFVLGVSSLTVERLAKSQSCVGGNGAGLVSPKGSRELYKMKCDDGKTLMAKCELRQCSILSHR